MERESPYTKVLVGTHSLKLDGETEPTGRMQFPVISAPVVVRMWG